MFVNNKQIDGLFRGTILHSGSATALSAIQDWNDPAYQKSHNDILIAVGCSVSNGKWTNLICLQTVPIETLVTAYTIVFSNSGLESPISLFVFLLQFNCTALLKAIRGDERRRVRKGTINDRASLLFQIYVLFNLPALQEHSLVKKMEPNQILFQPPESPGTAETLKTLTRGRTTTNELLETIPIYNSLSTDVAVLHATDRNFPLATNDTLQELLSYYPVTSYPNVGPPLSGGQWSRAVAIENDVQIFCPANLQAVQVSAVAPVFRWNAVLQSVSVPQWGGVRHSSDPYYVFPYKGKNMTTQSPADRDLMLSFQHHVIGFINEPNPNSLPSLKIPASVHWPQFDSRTRSRLIF
ncbi:hypothetical protein BDZ45DRAFT_736421 [Acephala macrosclerotiorum]|nr:hypothetical protein BDZ45DRAFT_736421 [Acephala macrosclerotiorum]